MIPIESVEATAYTVPTDRPEADGTLEWTETTIVLAKIQAGGKQGLGYTYANRGTAAFVREHLRPILQGKDATAIGSHWNEMNRAVRNLGRAGIAAMAISAADNALWDLKAKLLDLPLVRLLGQRRDRIDAYGSGGFTSYDVPTLQEQLKGWVEAGARWVKMKVGAAPENDVARVRAAREAIGERAGLFVDANGAYALKQADDLARAFRDLGVTWFEEPVSSDDLEGLGLLRRRSPPGLEIAAGEYGYAPSYFVRMLQAGAVDVLQADATRCGGVSGFLQVAALCDAWDVPLSAHCAPSIHRHLCCAATRARHVEYFHDHQRIERLLFDGGAVMENGALVCDPSRPGFGLELKEREADRYARN